MMEPEPTELSASVQPYGDLRTAEILVIGHDPTLQKSAARAARAFFLELLDRTPTTRAEGRQKNFAQRLCRYLSWLAGRDMTLSQLYVTNLCNDFLTRRGPGVLYIPKAKAEAGVIALTGLVARGKFKVILPMAEQTFYWLCELGFVDRPNPLVDVFLPDALPRSTSADKGLFVKTHGTPFVDVCGQLFHHKGVPIIPILHPKSWRPMLTAQWAPYNSGMGLAQQRVQQFLGYLPA